MVLVAYLIGTVASAQVPFTKAATKEVMKKVADWQIANPNNGAEHDDLDWTHAALYMGMIDWAEIAEQEDGNDTYYKWLLKIGRKNHFQVGKWMYHADFIAVGQPFIDLYKKYKQEKMIMPVMARANWVVEHPAKTTLELDYGKLETLDRWAWCDALFMAPPVYAKLYALTGEKKYIKFMNKEYKATYDYLFDKEENLFYRDRRYFGKKEANGKKVFWGRGNGWVFAGLPLIIDNLPIDCDSRNYYIQLFVKMAEAVRKTQCEGGDWRTSLLDPDSYDMPENSCSAFMCYGIAWGLRNEYLAKRTYKPVLEKGWKSLVKAVHTDGKLGYIQPVGAAPKAAGRDATDVYGVGAFLLAGSELYKLIK